MSQAEFELFGDQAQQAQTRYDLAATPSNGNYFVDAYYIDQELLGWFQDEIIAGMPAPVGDFEPALGKRWKMENPLAHQINLDLLDGLEFALAPWLDDDGDVGETVRAMYTAHGMEVVLYGVLVQEYLNQEDWDAYGHPVYSSD